MKNKLILYAIVGLLALNLVFHISYIIKENKDSKALQEVRNELTHEIGTVNNSLNKDVMSKINGLKAEIKRLNSELEQMSSLILSNVNDIKNLKAEKELTGKDGKDIKKAVKQ
ncbi:MAG: hypothetical protein GY749_12415 [Desulfobacteraceae bacterium]|nr:hypothetical protein [Desulfobacteraceae bacterium]